MTDTIKLVQNDIGPDLLVTLTDETTGEPIDVSAGDDVVVLHFRVVGATELTATLTATKPDGGSNGVVRFAWAEGDLAEPGLYEGEIEITFASGRVQTTYGKLKFRVRPQIG
jgi:hypothetical protein